MNLGTILIAILIAIAVYFAWEKHQSNAAAMNSSQTYLQSQGLINNPYQDFTDNLAGTGQETVNPLTGELVLTPGQVIANSNANNPIAGVATGTSSVS